MATKLIALCVVNVILISTVCESSKILFLLPLSSKSHNNVFAPLINELISRGHEATVFTSQDFKSENPKLKYVKIGGFQEFLNSMQAKLLNSQPGLTNIIDEFIPFGKAVCENFLTHAETKKLLSKGKDQFDLVIISQFYNECGLVAATLLGKHIMYVSPAGHMPWLPTHVPTPPSYVPQFFVPLSENMGFKDRAINAALSQFLQWSHSFYYEPAINEVIQKHIPQAPTVQEAATRVSFTLLNSDPVFETPRPGMPNVVKVGGMHLRKGKPLPKDFEDFINTSGDEGFIIFGLGSSAQSKNLPAEVRNAFLEAFSRLKQKVIWKFEDPNLPNQPSNVKITKWMPQQDLLAHPKTKLFISHGGMLSLEEAVYHEVPVVGIPLFADQPTNVQRVERMGIGLGLDIRNINADIIYNTVQKVLSNPSYKENMKKKSVILKDQPNLPLDRAVFWVEYVIRHNGASHLRSPGESLNFFQYFLLDVVGAVSVAGLVVLWLLCKTVKFAAKKLGLCRNCKTANSKKTQ